MEMVFKFKPGSRVKGDPQKVGERLMELREQHGSLSAEIVLNDARPEGSLLHRNFEWNDSVAAEEYRKDQARGLVQAVIVHRTEEHGDVTPLRAFVKINVGDVNSYEPIHRVLSDASLRSIVLRQCKSEIGALRDKVKAFEEFTDILGALDGVDRVVSTHLEEAALG